MAPADGRVWRAGEYRNVRHYRGTPGLEVVAHDFSGCPLRRSKGRFKEAA